MPKSLRTLILAVMATVAVSVQAAPAPAVDGPGNLITAPEQLESAAQRYQEDARLCQLERKTALRKKCLRAAKEAQGRAIAWASGKYPVKLICLDCGKVTSVRSDPWLLTSQRGNKSGQTASTAAGGRNDDTLNSTGPQGSWVVNVQYDNGLRGAYRYDQEPEMRSGDRVRRGDSTAARN